MHLLWGQFSGKLAPKGLSLPIYSIHPIPLFKSELNLDFYALLLLLLRCRKRRNELTTIIGAMYNSVMFVGINNCSTVQPMVALERTVFYRERSAGMYSALPYAMAQVSKRFSNESPSDECIFDD